MFEMHLYQPGATIFFRMGFRPLFGAFRNSLLNCFLTENLEMAFLKNNPRFMSPNLEANLNATEAFRKFSRILGFPAASVAIAWLLSRGPHILPIPGTRRPERLEELVMGVNIRLTDADLNELEKCLPIGWAHGDRYSIEQWVGPERYC